MKMYEILELQNLYNSIKDVKLPLKTTYKFTRLMRRAEEELASGLGYASVTLGKRILRAETAAVALTSVVMFSLGELK